MRFMSILSPAIAGIVLIAGCVSTKKYEARLADIMALETDKSDVEERLVQTRDALAEETAARTALENEAASLRSERDALIRQKESLFELNEDLNNTVARLSEEKMAVLREKEDVIAALSEEKQLTLQEKERAITEMKQTYDNLVSELNVEIRKGEIEVTQLRDKLTLSMVEKILFDSGSAEIKKNGKAVLDRVADILRSVADRQIRIEGHTDNVPIGPVLAAKFPTNWELSTARSTTVVRYLQEKGVDPGFLSAAGYSEYRPVDSNESDEGRAKNRRIEIVLIPLDADRITPQ
jgi:chemotaxis protein MotB